jgi:DNA-binding response OmpR family regulator
MRILLAEDDSVLGDAVWKSTCRSGFAVDWVKTGRDFDSAIANHHYDFVILDLGFPDDSGEFLLQRLRARNTQVPVIVVTARGSIQDKVAFFNMGADDFLVKPFDLDELTVRIRSLLRRLPAADADEGASVHGPLTLYPLKFGATWNGEPVSLTHREFWVMESLVRRKNQVLTRAQLEESLYGWGEEIESNAIEVYIHLLRRKFGAHLIHTVRGVGYQIAPLHQLVQSQPSPAGLRPAPLALAKASAAQDA